MTTIVMENKYNAKRKKPIQCFSCKIYFFGVEALCRHVALGCKDKGVKLKKRKHVKVNDDKHEKVNYTWTMKPFKCHLCSKRYYSTHVYDKHWSLYHGNVSRLLMYENAHHCTACRFVFDNAYALDFHRKSQKCILKSAELALRAKIIETASINVEKTININMLPEIKNIKEAEVGSVGQNQNSDNGVCCSNQEDTQINNLVNNTEYIPECTNYDEFPLPEITNTFSIGERNLFESLEICLPEQNADVSEIVQDDNYGETHYDCLYGTEPKNCISTDFYVEKNGHRLPVDEKQPCAMLEMPNKNVTKCRICQLNIENVKKYRKHFSEAHGNYSFDDMFDDGWKCCLCSSVHRDINCLQKHWIKKHREFYNKEQFEEFVKTQRYLN